MVTFVLEKNVDVAAQEVRDKVNRVLPQLPRTGSSSRRSRSSTPTRRRC